MGVEGPLSDLIQELKAKLKEEDLTALVDASKDDGIDEKELKNLSSTGQWFQWLSDKLLISNGMFFMNKDLLMMNLRSSKRNVSALDT